MNKKELIVCIKKKNCFNILWNKSNFFFLHGFKYFKHLPLVKVIDAKKQTFNHSFILYFKRLSYGIVLPYSNIVSQLLLSKVR